MLHYFKLEQRLSGLRKPPGAPVWRVNMALIRTRTEAIERTWYDTVRFGGAPPVTMPASPTPIQRKAFAKLGVPRG
jgi:hypothetical protein